LRVEGHDDAVLRALVGHGLARLGFEPSAGYGRHH
jgi:hypothetical protein